MAGFGGMKGGSVAYEVVEEDLATWGRELFGDPTRYITFAATMNPVCANDADAQVLYFPKSLHIPAGVTLTPSNRCKGLIIFVNGHLKIDGTISMSARGASAAGVDVPLSPVIRKLRKVSRTIGKTTLISESLFDTAYGTIGTVPAVGGAGGIAVTAGGGATVPGTAGTAGTGRKTGGGGAGCAYNGATSGRGGNGTAFSGGAGGGAANAGTGNAGSDSGGAGGNYVGMNASGGAGNPPGTYPGGTAPGTGTGGFIFIVARGNIYNEATGVISANGADGGDTTYDGGASGGGSINLAYGGTYTNLGTVQANGGSGGYNGGAGGAGCITIEQVARLVA